MIRRHSPSIRRRGDDRAFAIRAGLAAIFMSACGGGAGRDGAATNAGARLPDTCRVALGPAPPAVADPNAPRGAAPTVGRSTIIVGLEVPLAIVDQALESKVPTRVAEEKDHDIGMAGRLEYTVDRGAFSSSVDGDALVVEAPLIAHVRACAKGSCYAGCEPTAHVTARVPLRLTPDYHFRGSHVTIDLTRGCDLRVLGGLVRIDVTPIVQQRLSQETKRIEASIDHDLPDMRPEAERMWGELSKAHPLAMGSCVVLAPEGIAEGPASAAGKNARLRFGLFARPEMRMRCGDAPKAKALPPLVDDSSLPAEGQMDLTIVLPPDAPAIAMGSGDAFDVADGMRARIDGGSGTMGALGVSLAGDVCGGVNVRASDVAWLGTDGHALRLVGIAPLAGESARVASTGLDPARIAHAIGHVPIGLPIAPDQLPLMLPALAAGISDDHVTVAATVRDASPIGAGVRGDDLLAIVRMHGAATITAK